MRSSNRIADEFELDLGRYEIRRRGKRVKLEKKAMELLIFLSSRREQLVSRQDIMTKLWRRTCLSIPKPASIMSSEKLEQPSATAL